MRYLISKLKPNAKTYTDFWSAALVLYQLFKDALRIVPVRFQAAVKRCNLTGMNRQVTGFALETCRQQDSTKRRFRFYKTIVVAAILLLNLTFISNLSAGEPAPASSEHSGLTAKFEAAAEAMERELPLWSGLPFLGILLSIALGPLLTPHFWHRHFSKVSAAWALVFAIPFLFAYKDLALYEILHIYIIDYIPFIILLWGLFTVSGGILLRGTLVGTPVVNLMLILTGTILASWMGTTGAAMLMIRPILRANRLRKMRAHIIIFFIFLVANIGGSLTPLGDPPLFLGFLHGVPFFWTFRLMPEFGFTAAIVLIIFFIFDTIMWKREGITVDHSAERSPLRLEGWHNFIFLGGIVGAVLLSGVWHAGHFTVYGIHVNYQNLTRDGLILIMGGLSLLTTSKIVRRDNGFSWAPILEVAYLFAGIFMTIIPMLAMLRASVEGAMGFLVSGVTQSYHYFWISGVLSSFLDNAPTYLTFFNLALGRLGINEAQSAEMLRGVFNGNEALAAELVSYLTAISAGAVFMGANTYIGNAPNFMVRSIAIEDGVKMPSFFGYMLWSICILIPVFGLVTWVFFL